MVLQDIHAADLNLWTNVQAMWEAGNYSGILSLLANNIQLVSKYVNAAFFNNMTDILYNLEIQDDPTFKKDRIEVSSDAPTLDSGEVYFALE